VPLVEEGWYADDDVMVLEAAKRYLQPILEAKADTVILGCTHYPVLAGAISKVLGDGVTLINAGTTTAKAVAEFLKQNDAENQNGGERKFFVSDKPAFFKEQAGVLLSEDTLAAKVEKVDINNI
jgi:glutamate racemase